MNIESPRKFCYTFSLFISISILLLIQSVAQVGATELVWSPSTPVSNILQYPSSSSISVDNQGNVFVLYTALLSPSNINNLYFSSKSKDESWSESQIVNDVAWEANPLHSDMAIDKYGNVYAVWLDSRRGYPKCDIYYSFKPTGGVWQPNESITKDTQSVCHFDYPVITVDNYQTVHVAWQDSIIDGYHVYYTRKNVGENWSTAILVDDSNTINGGVRPDIATDAEGGVYAIWSDSRANWNNRRDIYFSYMPRGGSWTPGVQVNDSIINNGAYSIGSGSIAVDGQGNTYVVWADNRNLSDIYFSYRPAGGTWLKPNIRVNDDINYSYTNIKNSPKITVDSSGNAYVIWYDTRNYTDPYWNSATSDIYSSFRPYGGGWQTNKRVNDHVGWGKKEQPAIAMNNFGDTYAVLNERSSYGNTLLSFFLQPSDNLPPTSTYVVSGEQGLNDWHTSYVNVIVTATDNEGGSGVKEVHYVVNGTETVVSGNSASFTLSNEGVNSFIYWSIDNNGNTEAQKTVEIKIDTTVPVFNIISPMGTISELSPPLNINISDSVSGILTYQYLFNGVDVTQNTQLSLTYLIAGIYYLDLSATDNAGNMITETATFTYSPTTSSLSSALDRMYADGEITKLGTSLYDKLSLAQGYIDSSNYTDAKTTLSALVNQIRAQLDIHVTPFSGNILISDVTFLMNSLP